MTHGWAGTTSTVQSSTGSSNSMSSVARTGALGLQCSVLHLHRSVCLRASAGGIIRYYYIFVQ